MKIVWNNEKIQEWRQCLGYVRPHLVKKKIENYTQDYPGVSHEREVMPKKSALVRFPTRFDPIGVIFRNKDFFPWTCWRIPTRVRSVGV